MACHEMARRHFSWYNTIMFFNRYKLFRKEIPFVKHNGVFRQQISLFEAVAMIVSGTIGAGILGLPYAIAKVGVPLGIVYIVFIGFLMMGLNLLMGSLAVRTNKKMQLIGFAGEYLGKGGKWFTTFLLYFMLWGVMMVYIIGEGEVLAKLFGRSEFFWSTAFFVVVTLLIYIGISTVKVVELFLSLGVLVVVLTLSVFSSAHVDARNWQYMNLADLFFPYGVLLFAYYGAAAVPEARSILLNRDRDFKKAIIIAGLIVMAVYLIFSIVVIGVTGLNTSEIATFALGDKVGPKVFLLGNIFAALAMGTSCLMSGLAMRDSMSWDFKISPGLSTFLVCSAPFLLFILGFRSFIQAINIVGGVFISIEMFLILLIYWRAKQREDLPVGKYKLHHAALLVILLLITLSVGAVYSVIKLF